jgi:hypothetical protein
MNIKIFNKAIVLFILVVVPIFGLVHLTKAATTISLGTADDFAILAGAGITNTGVSIIVGDIGSSPIPDETGLTACPAADCVTLTGTNHNDPNPNDAATVSAKAALVTAYNLAAAQLPNITYDPIKIFGIETLTPGVYKSPSSLGLTGKLTLDAQGDPNAVFIFQVGSTLTAEVGSEVSLTNGAQACNVFWQVGSSATLKTDSIFKGNILALESISLQNGADVTGRVLARNGAVTLIANTITKTTCAVATPAPVTPYSASYYRGTINVVKVVVNDNGGTKTVADFPLFIDGTPAISGVTYTFHAPGSAFTVTETNDPNYALTFSGDCDMNGQFNLSPGDQKFCIVTNDDIGAPLDVPPVPPLIDMVKTANPLSLPAGSGSVVYTYTLRNIGTVPVTDITIVGDTCSPIILAGGDINTDTKLDIDETWVYTCTQTLSETYTNTAVATGWANGISAVDIASATVIVDEPIVPPLIHVVKKPNVLVAPVGGEVTYTYTVTNPGTVPLSNVFIADNKCTGLPGRVLGHPGDLNKNNLLESNETWTFTCQTNLTKTTTNIGTVNGSANGLTAVDHSLATVVVTPKLPNTGIAPFVESIPWNIVIPVLVGIFVISIFFYLIRRK